MISCTEFILAYNELFKYLEEKGGRHILEDFWRRIAHEYLFNLDELVREKGIEGMAEYWGHTLTEEAAKASIEVGEDYFRIHMEECPSVKLLNQRGVDKSPSYCHHCITLYKTVIEKYGFQYTLDIIDPERGICRVQARKLRLHGNKEE